MFIVGGLADSDSDKKQFRKDVISFDTVQKSWLPPVKKVLASSKKYKMVTVESLSCSDKFCFALFRGRTEKSEEIHYIDEISLDCLRFPGTRPSTRFLTNVPTWFKSRFTFCSDQSSVLYLCGGSGFARFSLLSQGWEKLQKPIGDLGEEEPWLVAVPENVFLLTGKPRSGDSAVTNYIQVGWK